MDPRRHILTLAMVTACVAVVLGIIAAPRFVTAAPEDFRAKINRVDTRDAPDVRIFVTFLDDHDAPINPKLIDMVEVYLDKRRVDASDVETQVWLEQPNGTDLMLVLPATDSLGETTRAALNEAVPQLIEPFGKDDRIGLVVYNRSVKVDPELTSKKSAIGNALGKSQQNGVRPFMFSALDKAIAVLETSPTERKKAIIYIGDGTDASTIKVDDLNAKLQETVTRARNANVHIFTVAFDTNGLNEVDTRSLKLLSRKTRATYRQAEGQRELLDSFDAAIGEILGELVIIADGDYQEQTVHEFMVRLQAEGSPEVETEPYKEKVEEVAINWILWGIVSGVCCLLSVVGFIVLIIIVIRIRKSRARKAAEELLKDLIGERPRKCEVCLRVMMDDWEECEFCEQGMEPLSPREQAPDFVYDNNDNKLCNTCGRVCLQAWTDCGFCAQGLEPLPEWIEKKRRDAMLSGDVDSAAITEEMMKKSAAESAAVDAAASKAKAEALKRQELAAKGYKECPGCRNMIPPNWPECLYCAGKM